MEFFNLQHLEAIEQPGNFALSRVIAVRDHVSPDIALNCTAFDSLLK